MKSGSSVFEILATYKRVSDAFSDASEVEFEHAFLEDLQLRIQLTLTK